MRSLLAKITLGLWAAALSVVITYQMAGHLLTLPQPAHDDPVLAAQLAAHRVDDRWQAVHILYGECKCSRQVAEHILERGPLPAVSEFVLFVGEDPEMAERFAAAGYGVEVTTPEGLNTDWNVPAAPIMVVADPFGGLQYVGGYTDRKQGADVRDVAILQQVMEDVPVPALPLFGCAVSRELSEMVDPLGVR